tara:strand:- start:120 stop:929 length:810 start_codon:yes stop_codon:yes gene_type:complete
MDCPGLKNNYNCSVILGNIKRFKISGLAYSGIVEVDSSECGDDICSDAEDCLSCEVDCGVCVVPLSDTGGSGGSGGGGGSSRRTTPTTNVSDDIVTPPVSVATEDTGDEEDETDEELPIKRDIIKEIKDFVVSNKTWFIYGGIGFGGLIVLLMIVWIVMIVLRKRKKKDLGLGKDIRVAEKQIVKEIHKPKPVGEKKKWFGWFGKKDKNKEIEKLLLRGGRYLSSGDVKSARIVYKKIRGMYNSKYDENKELYRRILGFHQNILNSRNG